MKFVDFRLRFEPHCLLQIRLILELESCSCQPSMICHFHSFPIGPKLPFQLHSSAMVSSPNGKAVYIIGGYNASQGTSSKTILELKSTSMEWFQQGLP